MKNFYMNNKPLEKPKSYGIIPCSDNVEVGNFVFKYLVKLFYKQILSRWGHSLVEVKERTLNFVTISMLVKCLM